MKNVFFRKILSIFLLIVVIVSFNQCSLASASEVTVLQSVTVTAQSGGTSPLHVALDSLPVAGSLLVLRAGMTAYDVECITGISQAGVLWSKAVRSYATGINAEIWYGRVIDIPSSDMYISLSSATYAMVVNVREYSALFSSNPLDLTAVAVGAGSTSSTGTTGNSSSANMLFVGVISATLTSGEYAQSSPTNGFVIVDNATSVNEDAAFLDKVVSFNSPAESGTTVANCYQWAGAVATFVISSPATVTPSPTVMPSRLSDGPIDLTENFYVFVFLIAFLCLMVFLIIRPVPLLNFIVACFGLLFVALSLDTIVLPFNGWCQYFLLILSIVALFSAALDMRND